MRSIIIERLGKTTISLLATLTSSFTQVVTHRKIKFEENRCNAVVNAATKALHCTRCTLLL